MVTGYRFQLDIEQRPRGVVSCFRDLGTCKSFCQQQSRGSSSSVSIWKVLGDERHNAHSHGGADGLQIDVYSADIVETLYF